MEANEHFKELVRLGRLPGPNNLLAPTAEFVRGTRSARRREISTHLERAWQAAGGAPLSGQAWGSREEREKWELRLKPALRKLRAQGALRETAIHGVYESVTADTALGADGNDGAEISLGSGNYLVYGTYDKRVRETARAQDEERWLMKVGSTKERSPYGRIQDKAFLSDKPSWGIALWSDTHVALEKLIKGILEYRGRRYSGTGGVEWYVTNPQEIEEIYRAIVGDNA